MKNNKLTPGGNLVWEGSRMMLPEHKQALIKQRISLKKQTRPELTEEEQQEMFGRLKASRSEKIEVTITVYGEYENQSFTGIVTGIDPRLYLVKLEFNHDWKLFDFTDIIGVE
ncbi:YolD-like family protein [Paenibacillus filicis]|uniref:YolD-like family protein n=1 Tax=Paenibacillus gyeongsangnamensis TaxID=3388067 RepID=A0ABT4QBS9_9BACL|nr:YolD-like family protein [Paenibacillus filicis]MCZ8514347.1 YolD-like family protein [Paenibacillus filicis]